MEKHLVCIILPMYNEEQSFGSLRQMFNFQFKLPPKCDHQIIIVNDGSRDKTLEYALKWRYENQKVSILSHTHNLGLGRAIITGFYEAIQLNSTCIVTMDADASHPSEVIYKLVEAVIGEADIAIASRFAKGGKQIEVSLQRKIYSLGARLLLSCVFPLKGVRDYTVGFRAYKTLLVKEALSRCGDSFLVFDTFTATAEILLKMATLADKIVEVPLVLRYDLKKGPSKMKVLATIRDYARLAVLPKQKCPLGRGLRI